MDFTLADPDRAHVCGGDIASREKVPHEVQVLAEDREARSGTNQVLSPAHKSTSHHVLQRVVYRIVRDEVRKWEKEFQLTQGSGEHVQE